ncbi:ABC transporter substrate-binding protein [Halanaerobacter jeridensis]|uniref:Glycine betaine/proline transport system substrate-binding protein n=1 Tax=Halanaerobacter jeridensis TaxID=706427 RepID=A0A938XRH6_9FIRM|nr:ABC transporter substrate-binding protein [Halanaerobacter jeridensis]MBM7556068.1 glycine betaine/proline transport system substrate-binding protein [Halanaerobacter jeridensis]
MFKKKSKSLLVAALSVLLILTVVGCGGQQTAEQNESSKQDKKMTEIKFGHVNWPGVTMKTHVAKNVLEKLGYKVTMDSYTQQVLFTGMEKDQIDAFLGNWDPTMKVNFKPYQEKGVVENVRVNLPEALYQTAVPKYVWEAGVKSMADLQEHADKFDNRIVGIEPGNDGNQIIKDAIDNNTYNLKEWELTTGSTAAMLAAVGKATANKDWIAFNGWKPHWMNVKYDIKYLKDPEGIWGSNDVVYSVARPELKEEGPHFYKFLENFAVTSDIQSAWILEYQKKERDPKKVAEEWINNNPDLVKEWVKGMKTVDGKDAQKVLTEKLSK